MAIEGQWDVILTIRIAVPPGQKPEDAGKQIANAGACLPIGLVSFVKRVDINVVPSESTGPKLL